MIKKTTLFLLLSLIVEFSFAQPITQSKEFGISDPASSWRNPILETQHEPLIRAGNSLLAVNDSVLMSKGMSFLMIDVLANDSTGSCSKGAIQLAIETPPTKALVEIDPNNELKYSILSSSFGKDSLVYKITCGGIESTAKVYITIEDLPVNVINGAAVCYELMPPDLPFTIRRKFSTTQGFTMGGSLGGDASGGDGYCIDGFTSPLVVDLNGDTKPEIIALGVYGTYGAGNARPSARYINIYNGQTGARMYSKDFGTNYSQSSGTGYHRPPSPLAVADLDRDGIVEIVYTRPDGAVIVYKPVFSGKTITAMNILWEASVKFKAPLSATNSPFNTPHPYIVDINGDGIPEVIVYNKVYNGQTGALLMAWQGAAATPKYSSLAANIGLVDNVYSTPTTQANANSIKGVALTGRRPSNGTYADEYVATPAIWDIDGDGIQEIVTGNRIYKIQINSLTNHTLNTYTTIEGPVSVTLTENTNGTKTTHYLSDGFTRVADIDGDGHLDIIVTQPCDNGSLDTKILVYIWDPRYPSQVKAAITYYSDGANGSYSIPFIGDINGKKDGWDGANYSLKLPEICILSGVVQINRSGRTGIKFHPLTDEAIRQGTAGSSGTAAGWDNNQTSNSNRRFNRPFSTNSLCGHIIGLTYDAAATEIEERLKLSWAMEHLDRSHSTGITLFDFDNDGTKDICYKDEATLRVLSPARGNNKMGRDYVTVNEKVSTPGTSILFSTPETNHHPDAVFGGTGLEYPVIADVNLDGCADIIVTRSADARNIAAANGYIMVFEYDSYKWSPSPPVWNQNLYNPLHINDDLTVPTNPQDLLTPYQDGMGNTITPYNGAWIQQPIVKYGEDYVPIVRKADAVLINMDVEVISLTSTKVTLTIRSIGDATIAALTPIAFYNGGTSGKPIESSIFINVREVGVDIFKNDIETIDFFLTGNFNNCLIWARIMDDNITFPSLGEDDCDTTNNTLSGRGCLYSHTQSGTPTLTVPQFVTTQLSDSICYGDSLLFGGQYLKDANTYYLIQKFTDVDCDSIVELKLTVNPLLTKTIAKATCVNAGYDFYGDMLYGAGIYNKRVASTTGACDTIVTLDLTIHQIDTTQLSTSICTGDSLFFYGQYLKLADTYYHTLQSTITGCDSVIELTLTLNPILTKTIAREACVNVGYSFYGDMLYATGIYNKWAPSTTGSCDTIVVLDLTIRQIDTTQLSTSICTGDSLFFYGHYLKLADTYYHTLQSTTTGCDSVIELILTMNPILTKNIAREACVNVGYSFYGDMLYATGIYNKLVPSTTSTCDTIVTLDLKVHQIDTTQRSASICYGDSLLFFGQYLKLADTYYHTLPSTITGCDSVIELTLTVNPLLTKTIETEACVNVGYHFYGDMLYATGIYSKRVASTTGACDTIVTLDLTVHQIDTTQQSASICYGDSLFFYGQYLKLADTYYHTLQSIITGCDSVIEFTLTVNPLITTTIETEACVNVGYDFYGDMLYATGIYNKRVASATGACDTIVTLDLMVHQIDTTQMSASICIGDSLFFYGQYLKLADTYYHTLPSTLTGCDGVIELTLTVDPLLTKTIETETCVNVGYSFYGDMLYATGIYNKRVTSTTGTCDTIVTLDLTVHQIDTTQQSASICIGDSLFFYGQYLKLADTYYHTLQSTLTGCDSVIEFTLTVNPLLTKTIETEACVNVGYSFYGDMLYATGMYNKRVASTTGTCDTIVTLDLTVHQIDTTQQSVSICIGDSLFFYGQYLKLADTYYHTLQSTLTGCDSVIEFTLTVNPLLIKTIETETCVNVGYSFYGDMLYATGIYSKRVASTTGTCDTIVTLDLTVHQIDTTQQSASICIGDSLFFYGQYLKLADTYYHTLQSTLTGCDSVIEFTLTVNPLLTKTIETEACVNVGYSFYGDMLYATGIYNKRVGSTTGTCDTIVTLDLTVHQIDTTQQSASICIGDSLFFYGQYLKLADTYYHTLQSTLTGCDSVIEFTLTVNPLLTKTIETEACVNVGYSFYGDMLYATGIYNKRVASTTGTCDTIVTLDLTVHQIDTTQQSASICIGDSLFFYGQYLKLADTYYHTLQSTLTGCDSVIEFTLTVNPLLTKTIETEACVNVGYNFYGDMLYATGIYNKRVASTTGTCDTIVTLDLTVHQIDTTQQSASICYGDSLFFYGQYLKLADTYYHTLQSTLTGCDSVIEFTLTVNPLLTKTIETETCVNVGYSFYGDMLYATGIYNKRIASTTGTCDTIVTLDLTVHQIDTTQQSASICYGDSLFFYGQYLKLADTYYHTLQSTLTGCDSVIEFTLTVNPLLTKTIETEACVNVGYSFYGDMLYATGMYNKRVASTTGTCDTIVTLDLTVHQIDTTQQSASICYGDSLFFYGQYLKLADTYYHTLQSTLTGCDSVIEFTLTVNPLLTKTIETEACVNVGYSFYGDMLYATGIYNKRVASTTGTCDTIVTLDLTVHQIDTTQQSASICIGDSLFFYGQYLKLADTYYHTLQSTITGCDSVIEFTLTVNPLLTKTIETEACVNVGYSFYGDMLYVTGIYNKRVASTTGTCDTIVTLDLTVHQIDTTQQSASICIGDSLFFYGQYLKLADTYYHTLQSTLTGCDSVIEFTLTVNPLLTKTIETEACVNVGYSFYGDMLYATGMYNKRVASTTGTCDTIVTLDLTVHQIDTTQQSASICIGDSLFFYGQYLKLADTYYHTLQSTLTGCDSVIEFTLTVNPLLTKTIETEACVNVGYNFYGDMLYATGMYNKRVASTTGTCDTIVTLDLTVHQIDTTQQSASICIGDSLFFYGQYLKLADTYYHTLQSTLTGCDSVIEFTLTVNPLLTKTIETEACVNVGYSFYGDMLYATGMYNKRVASTTGTCDTIVTLDLTVHQIDTTQQSASICIGDSLFFYGQYLKLADTYYHTLQSTLTGCDSVIEFTLTVNPLLTKTIETEACVNVGYSFYGDMLYATGIYNKRVASTTGTCDTIVTLDLTVHQIDTTQQSASICIGDSLFFYGQYLKLADTYYHTLQSTLTGCDSVIEFTLTVNPLLTKTIETEACVNVGYSFYGDMLYATGIYNKRVASTTGTCDTIVTLDLTVHQIDTTQQSASICYGDSLLFYGQYLKLADTYYHTLQSTITGCDSVIEFTLTVNPLLTKTIARETCVNAGYSFYGDMLYATGMYNKRVASATGTCDTIVTLDLTVHQLITTSQSASICFGDSLLFFDQYLKDAGIYYQTLQSTLTGCDSVIEFTLTVNPLLTKTIETETCVNVGYSFYGDMLYATGMYNKRVASTTGACDTIVTLDLTVHQIDTTQQSASICIGDSLFFYGQYLKLADTYYHTLQSTITGCDSVIALTLTIKNCEITYIITASSGEGGAITPEGEINVTPNANQTFTFTPEFCYEIDRVWIDGIPDAAVAAAGFYTFENILANHTISVSFKIINYTITATAGENGTINPLGDTAVICGANQTFFFIPDAGYYIETVLIDNIENQIAKANGFYIFENVTKNHTIHVTFTKQRKYHVNIEVNNPEYGYAMGAGDYPAFSTVNVESFVEDCYRFVNWTINGVEVSTEAQYAFTITSDITLVANFYALDFDTYCLTLWDNTFLLNLRALRDSGYVITNCKWFEGDESLSILNTIDEFSYSAGTDGTCLKISPTYYKFQVNVKNFGCLWSTKKVLTHHNFSCNIAKMMVYPNPVTQGTECIIEGVEKDVPINVYNYLGACVSSTIAADSVVKLMIDLPVGIYLIHAGDKTEKIMVIR